MTVRLRSEIAALPPYKQGRPAPINGHKLSSNENPFEPLDQVIAEAAKAAAAMNRYPDATALALRQRLAERYRVGVDEIIIGAGSVALLAQFIQAAAAPGDEVIYAWRSFEAYPGLVTVAGATSVQVSNRDDQGHDLEAIADAVTERTRVVIVCSPNNPTGVTVSAKDFTNFMAKVPSDRLVVLDEAYIEFVTDSAAVNGAQLIGRYPNLVILRTFSKAYGLAGLRVGYAIGPRRLLEAATATAIPLGVTAISSEAAIASLRPEIEEKLLARVAIITDRRDQLSGKLREQGWRIPATQGNFVWLPTGKHTAQVAEKLFHSGIVGRAFQSEGIRVSIGDASSIEILLKILGELVDIAQEGG